MRRKFRTMLSTALIVSMLGTMFSGTAFGAKRDTGNLFKGNATPFLMWTNSDGYADGYEARSIYANTEVELASPADALMASDSNALTASPSEALSWDYREYASSLRLSLGGNDSDSDKAFYAWLNDEKTPFPRKIKLSVGEDANRYQGEVEVRLNWFNNAWSNNYANRYDRVEQTVDLTQNYRMATPSVADITGSGSSYKVNFEEVQYPGDEHGKQINGVKVKPGNYDYEIVLDFSDTNLVKIDSDRKDDRYIKVELKKGSDLIGFTFVTLPVYSEINGVIYVSVTDYLKTLGDKKNTLEELKITKGDITGQEWQMIRELPALKRLYLSKDLHTVNLETYSSPHSENTHLEEVYFNWDEKKTAVSGPTRYTGDASVKTIPSYAFDNCTSLKIASLPGIEGIGTNAFQGDTSLKDLAASDVTGIGEDAFSGCAALERVELPSAKTLYQGAFKDCTALKEIELPELFDVGSNAFENCKALTELSLPKLNSYGVGESVFKNCTSLLMVDLPRLPQVSSNMFEGCTALSTVKISEANWVYCDAFKGLSNKPENRIRLYLPGDQYPWLFGTFEEEQRFTYTFIDWWGDELTGTAKREAEQYYARNDEWRRVLGLTLEEDAQLYVEYRISGIGDTKYGAMATLAEIFDQIRQDGEELSRIESLDVYDGKLSDADWKELSKLTGLQRLVVSDSSCVGESRYEMSIPAGVKLPKSLKEAWLYTVTNIPAGTFENCAALETVRLDSVTSIGDRAFAGCASLNRLIMQPVPPTLGKNVFEGCTASGKRISLIKGDEETAYEIYKKADSQWLSWIGEEGGTTTPTLPPAGGSSSSGRDRGTHYGSWVQDAGGWYYTFNKFRPVSQWGYLPYNGKFSWYYFNQNGYMMTGWYTDEFGRTYYLHPLADGSRGHMYTGWNEIDRKWYYFSTEEGSANGMLLKNTTTPDGYLVDANGVRVQ